MRVTEDELEKILESGQVKISPSSLKNIKEEDRSPSSKKKNKGEGEDPSAEDTRYFEGVPVIPPWNCSDSSWESPSASRGPSPKKSKYWNIKITIEGIVFDSKKEADRYLVLRFLLRAGVIDNLKLQETFLLQRAYTTPEGKRIKAITYTPDFTYLDNTLGFKVIEDVKNEHTATQQFKIKWKMMQEQYPQYKYLLT